MLLKQKNSPYYYAKIYLGGYKYKWFCLKTTDKQEAKYLHAQLEQKEYEKRKAKHIQKILGNTPLNEETANLIKLKDVVRTVSKLKDYSNDTLNTYNRFYEWIKTHYNEHKTAESVTKQIALHYLQTKYGNGAPKSYNTIKSALSAVWKGLAVFDIPNIWIALPNKTANDSLGYRNLTDAEVTAILNQTQGFWHHATLISYYTGLRKKDIFELKWNSVKEDHLQLIPSKTSRNKKAVYIPLHADLQHIFSTLPKTSDKVFPDAKYTSGTYHKQYNEILKKCDIGDTTEGKASFHSLRATFITNAEESGFAPKVIQGIVGHGSPKMTQRYSHDKESAKVVTTLKSIAIK